jgi:putative peptidoglycan lipid II flippase
VALAWLLTRADYAGTHAGLALAISVAAVVNAWLLYRGLKRDGIVAQTRGWLPFLARVVAANLGMALALLQLSRPLDWWLGSSIASRSLWLGLEIAVAAAVYFGVLFMLGLRASNFRLRP